MTWQDRPRGRDEVGATGENVLHITSLVLLWRHRPTDHRETPVVQEHHPDHADEVNTLTTRRRLEPIENPFGPEVLPMSSE
ncbi:MAG TPA: hypothetical protein VKE51_27360 [Vicinamibacterales bacterium]|nr:hypothetical protein [Vicinamibacterales bacterium]